MFGEHQFGIASTRKRLARDVSDWTSDELAAGLRDLAALRNALDACEARVLAAFDSSGAWKSDGAVDAASWLRTTTGVSARDASGRVAAASVLSGLPDTLAALADGDITAEHAVTLARAAQRTPAVVDHEATLIAIASGQGVDAFARSVRRHEQLLAADGGAAQAMRQHERRSVTATKASDGMTLVQARLEPTAASTFMTVLDRIAEELWRSDRDEARIVGLHVRRADALVELARRADAVDPATAGLRRPDPALVALIDHRVLVDELTDAGACCQLADGTPISPATARRLACSAGILPAVLGGASVPLDWGKARRLATPAQKLALMVRDGDTCVFPECDRPWTWCGAHHLAEFPRGPSDLENLALVCDTHHHFVHEGRWELRQESDGGWRARGPTGVQLYRPPPPTRFPVVHERASRPGSGLCADSVQLDFAGVAS